VSPSRGTPENGHRYGKVGDIPGNRRDERELTVLSRRQAVGLPARKSHSKSQRGQVSGGSQLRQAIV
jgi:hypothetical protein